ncbi:MAG: FUSC family protein [Actinoallomurus sp.]
MPSHGWTSETWDRVVASDPGLQRLRMALSAATAMATALGVEYEFAMVTHAGPKGVLVAMLLGTVIAMMGSMALTGTQAWPKVRTAALFPIAIGAGLLPGSLVAGHAHWMLAVFVAVMFLAVYIRRFGMAFFFYGFMIWMGYFFAVFLDARPADLPGLLAAVAVSTVWILLLSVTVLRTNPRRTLRRVRRAFDARARAVARVCADLLETGPADERARARTLRTLHSRQLRLAETALIIEGWSGEEGALPQGWSAPALRRRLLDAHAAIDELATAAESLVLARGRLAAEAARIAGHLARREYRTAEQLARALLALDQVRAQDLAAQDDHDCYAQHLANAALEFTALAARGDEPPDAEDAEEFSPAVTLALGVLPGSPAVADDVAARGSWNPLSRMSLTSRQAVQVAVAGTLAIIIGRQISETRYYWAVIAAFIAFTGTATRSETFIKAGNRVLGTLLGLGAGVALVHLTAGHTMWVLVAVVASMSMGFYLVNVSYACMIFFVTIMVSQMYSALHEFSAGLLVLRLEETAAGAAVGVAVALLVLPTSTRDTVHAARNQYFTALADLLRVTAAHLNGERPEIVPVAPSEPQDAADDDGEPADSTDLDALMRTLDLRLRQLALVARPLTRSLGRPLIWRNNPRVVRHRLTLHADLNRQIRALALQSRRSAHRAPDAELAGACDALAGAASALAGVVPASGHPVAEVAQPLATAESLLLSREPTDATGLLPLMTRMRWLLNELAVLPPAIRTAAEHLAAGTGASPATALPAPAEPAAVTSPGCHSRESR